MGIINLIKSSGEAVHMRKIEQLFKTAVLSALLALLFIGAAGAAEEPGKAKYIFLFIGDGMGEPQVQGADLYRRASGKEPLVFPSLPARGSITTSTAKGVVTDSAAAGTALASGYKTENGILNMDSSGANRFKSVAMFARDRGMKVGIVTSSFMNDSTPAAFYAWSPSRTDFYEIGKQLAESGFHYFGGGGLSRRKGRKGDLKDLYEIAAARGYKVLRTTREILAAEPGGKVLASGSAGALHYEIDRPGGALSLADWTRLGIKLLDNPGGFFMMVEGGKIDWACHRSDTAAMVHDVAAFDDAVKEALTFARARPDDTLIVITADHETGGMSMDSHIAGERLFSVLSKQKGSNEVFDLKVAEFRKGGQEDFDKTLAAVAQFFGLQDFSREEKEELRTAFAHSMKPKGQRKRDRDYNRRYGPYEPLTMSASRILARRAGVGWTSYGHTGAAVPVYAQGPGSEYFAGERDNTNIGRALIHLLP